MTGKDKENLFNAWEKVTGANRTPSEDGFTAGAIVVSEDVASDMTTDDAAFEQGGTETAEPETFHASGPAAADGLEELKEEEKDSQSAKKIEEDNINNSNIMSKSTFDKLYEDVMGDESFALTREDDLDMGDDLGGDDMMNGDDEMGGDVTVTLTSDQVDVLRDILGQLDGDGEGGEDDLGELGDESGMDDMGFEDGVQDPNVQREMQVHAEPKAVGNANHLASTGSGGNKVALSTSGAGNAKHGTIKEEPVPRDLGGHGDRSHKDAGNTGSGSNKVGNPGTPGVNQSLFGN
jgi:hypothetical protein